MYNPYASASDTVYSDEARNLQHPRPQHVQNRHPQSQYVPPADQQYQADANNYQGYTQPQYGQPSSFQGYSNSPQQQYQQQYNSQFDPQQQYNNMNTQVPPAAQNKPQGQGTSYGDFFSDPAASMAAQFAKSSFGQSNNYIQQNFGSYIPVAGELKYYFKVSNSYVWKKIVLILFPYRHRDWSRIIAVENGNGNSGGINYAPASEDINAPDLYIPLMSYVTYILLWASFQGLKGDFHPQVFGYLASQTLACSFLDMVIFKVGLYLLNCSSQSSLWDLISFSGYKYVTIICLLCWKQIFGNSWVFFYTFFLAVVGSLSLFLMRSLKFLVLPIGSGEGANVSISNSQRRLRVQFLFIYSVAVQFLIVLFMSR